MLPFFKRVGWRVKGYFAKKQNNLIEFTNISEDKFLFLTLQKRGYNLKELEKMEAEEILDIVEFEEINDAIETVRFNQNDSK